MSPLTQGTPASSGDKDLPLRDDIRLLGRLLGDTVREQQGEAVFAVIEEIRRASVQFNQNAYPARAPALRAELDAILNALPPASTNPVVRAFSYFLHLANIAEDQHHIRRRRWHDRIGSAPLPGSFPHALDALHEARVPAARVRAFFDVALVSPVLTAHPTEVSRKSILQCQHEIAALLDARDRTQFTESEQEDNDIALRRAVLRLWRTRMLRPYRLAVVDEIKNGIRFYEDTFFAELPRLYGQLQDLLARRFPGANWDLPPFLRIGSWIGGDRDGNPFVTADILETTLRLQSTAAIEFYLAEIHALGAELSLSQMLHECSPALGGIL